MLFFFLFYFYPLHFCAMRLRYSQKLPSGKERKWTSKCSSFSLDSGPWSPLPFDKSDSHLHFLSFSQSCQPHHKSSSGVFGFFFFFFCILPNFLSISPLSLDRFFNRKGSRLGLRTGLSKAPLPQSKDCGCNLKVWGRLKVASCDRRPRGPLEPAAEVSLVAGAIFLHLPLQWWGGWSPGSFSSLHCSWKVGDSSGAGLLPGVRHLPPPWMHSLFFNSLFFCIHLFLSVCKILWGLIFIHLFN